MVFDGAVTADVIVVASKPTERPPTCLLETRT